MKQHAFPCGSLALDFVGTLQARRDDEPVEKLNVPGDLNGWFAESPLALVDATPTTRDLAHARELREGIYALVRLRLEGRALSESDIAVVNHYAAHPPLARVLLPDGRLLQGTSAAALSEIARDAIEIVGGPQSALLRECARPECTQVYVDRSRGHRREWCSMATCGSRMKVAAYRSRRRATIA